MKNFKLYCEGKQEEDEINRILDKFNKFGTKNLTKDELERFKKFGEEPEDKGNKNRNIKSEIKSNAHYNQYITKVLSDLKNGEITEEIANQFVQKYLSKEDLFSVIVQLLKDGKIDHLTNENL